MLSKISARTLVLGTVLLGLSLAPALAAPAAVDGPDIEAGTGPTDESGGEDGRDGATGENGSRGGTGGNVTSVVGSSHTEVNAGSVGGNGGHGGDAFADHDHPMPAGNGGNGGNGGNIDLTLTGEVTGIVRGRSLGGNAGAGGQGAEGADGGQPMPDGSAGEAGKGGNVTITIADTATVTGTVYAVSSGGVANGTHEATAGDITVTVSGVVNGSIHAKSGENAHTAGTINVVLSGGVVTGVISADANATSKLTFDFDVADQAEFNAANTALTGSAAEGTVTINGKGYNWAGFDSLVNLLRYVGPGDKVEVSVQPSSSPSSVNDRHEPLAGQSRPQQPQQVAMVFGNIPLVTGKPEMARCSGATEIRTVRQDDGSIVVIHHSRGEDRLIGQLRDGTFRRSQAAQDWDVRVGNEGRSVEVSNDGNAVSSCSFS